MLGLSDGSTCQSTALRKCLAFADLLQDSSTNTFMQDCIAETPTEAMKIIFMDQPQPYIYWMYCSIGQPLWENF